MKDNLQGISFDRYLMRAKDVVLIIGSLCSLIFAGYVAVIYIVRMNDRINILESQLSQVIIQLADMKGKGK